MPPSESVLGKLIYSPGSRSLNEGSLSVDEKHSDGRIQLNYHNLFGLMQGEATNKYFSDQNLRSLIISGNTFAGQGKFTSHQLGDNTSKFEYFRYSISGIMHMNIFGINFVGSDISVFMGIATEDLCQKWTSVSTFYPFARNHDDIHDVGQEPYRYSEQAQEAMRHALRLRYALLRYFYTQLYLVSVNGGTFWKPLFFKFPEEAHAYDDIERNIMIGPSIKFFPMIDNSSDTSQSFIMPAGRWCNIINYEFLTMSKLSDVSLPTTASILNLHFKPGRIIPVQRDAESVKVNTTVDLEDMAMGLMVNPVGKNKASGEFYADDGVSENSSEYTHIFINFSYNGSAANMTFDRVSASYTTKEYTKLKIIEIFGLTLATYIS